LDGVRFLVDPALVTAAPVSLANRAFAGTDLYTPDDMPDIDCLLITHDHYDHLDYRTVKRLKNRIGKVICGLGVGEHFDRWKFNKDIISEFDWNNKIQLTEHIAIHIFPARHFSGRSLSRNNTLWVSYLIETPTTNIFISGDTGYDTHFAEISKRFPKIDLAIMENGQYNENWKYIHMLPNDLVQAIKDLNPKRTLTVHHSKYALSKHAWNAPLENISNMLEKESFNIITPMIGETMHLNDSTQTFGKWWDS
jgi:L-ascorbate metabolism protein UlaG (beta-lactamase superfamily)